MLLFARVFAHRARYQLHLAFAASLLSSPTPPSRRPYAVAPPCSNPPSPPPPSPYRKRKRQDSTPTEFLPLIQSGPTDSKSACVAAYVWYLLRTRESTGKLRVRRRRARPKPSSPAAWPDRSRVGEVGDPCGRCADAVRERLLDFERRIFPDDLFTLPSGGRILSFNLIFNRTVEE